MFTASMTTRRELLKATSSLALSAATSSSLRGTSSTDLASGKQLAWPKPIGSPVLESLRPVIEGSRDVQTHYDKIVEVASWMAYEELPMPNIGVPFGLEKTADIAIDFVMVSNCIDSAFTDFKSHIKFQVDFAGEHFSDADAMQACLKRAMDNGVPVLEGKFLARVTKDELAKIFAGNIEMPMLEEKMAVFHQVGDVLNAKYGGRFLNFVRSCSSRLYDNGNGLVDRLVKEFPRYNDVSQFDGHEVKFYKLSQLGCWGMYSGLASTGAFKLEDAHKLTAFADYIVPAALRVMGMTSYSPALEKTINSYQMIERDSRQEIEIRAHCLYATALLREEVNKLRPADLQVIIPQIDARLWTHYHATTWPHHLTKTIMY
jgi:Potential Queuosine, Q, salvage protein family